MQGIKNLDRTPKPQKGRAAIAKPISAISSESIERGDFPNWNFSVQIMPESDVGKHWYNPVRPYQSLAAQGLPADRGRRPRAQPQSGELFRRSRAGRALARQHRAGHRPFARQDAAGPHLLLRATRIAIASASMRISFPSTSRAAPCTPTTPMAPCGSPAIRIPMPTTSRTRSTARCRTSASASRRSRSPATPTATITATAMTTIVSPATCSG